MTMPQLMELVDNAICKKVDELHDSCNSHERARELAFPGDKRRYQIDVGIELLLAAGVDRTSLVSAVRKTFEPSAPADAPEAK